MAMPIKINPNGSIGMKAGTTIALCPSVYKVVFPADPFDWPKEYTLTESGGMWIASGSADFVEPMMGSPSDNSMAFFYYLGLGSGATCHFEFTIEMTRDGGTGERAVRVQVDATISQSFVFPNPAYGSCDSTEYFASVNTFNLAFPADPSPRFLGGF